jgi:phosphoglycolate phosphatase
MSIDPTHGPVAVIFDLDGTLLDTIDDLADAMNHILKGQGFETHPTGSYFRFIGNGMVELVERALPEEIRGDSAAVHGYTEAFRARYSERWNIKTKPYEGIPAVLDALTEANIPMGVCSNKPDQLTKKCISVILDSWSFGSVLGQSDAFPRKPDPASALQVVKELGADPGRTWFVGDSGVDMKTATAAEMVAVGVLWGFRSRVELEDNNAGHVVESPAALLDLLLG